MAGTRSKEGLRVQIHGASRLLHYIVPGTIILIRLISPEQAGIPGGETAGKNWLFGNSRGQVSFLMVT
jgi:hypothetical protein